MKDLSIKTNTYKRCKTCKQNKLLNEFPIRKDSPDGYRNECKECRDKYTHWWRENKENIKKEKERINYRKENPPSGMKYCIGCDKDKLFEEFGKGKDKFGLRVHCKECHNNENKIWKKEHKEQCNERSKQKRNSPEGIKRYKEWYAKRKETIIKKKAERYKTDGIFRLIYNLRGMTHGAIKGKYKLGKTISWLGCTAEFFKEHIESKFYDNPITGEKMTWDNYTFFGWHVDHIIPLCSIRDEKDVEQIKKVCHYTNLRPLWMKENLGKIQKDIELGKKIRQENETNSSRKFDEKNTKGDSIMETKEMTENVEDSKRYTGVVVWFSKGIGFISKDDGTGDIFVHFSNINMEGYKVLRQGQKVEFSLGTNHVGEQAVNVRVLQPKTEVTAQ